MSKRPDYRFKRNCGNGTGSEPELYSVSQVGGKWRLSRRDFIAAAAAVGASLARAGSETAFASEGAELQTIRSHAGSISCVAFSPAGYIVASGGSDNSIKLWDLTEQKVTTLEEHSDGICALAFSPDGERLVSGSRDGTVRLWDVSAGKVLRTLEEREGCVHCVSYNPVNARGIIAAAGDDSKVKLWHLGTGEMSLLDAGGGCINSVAFSVDGNSLAWAGGDTSVKLWDMLDGGDIVTLTGHEGDVCCVAFSPAGDLIASTSQDGTIRLWNVATGEVAKTLTVTGGCALSVAFSQDGSLLASGGTDKTATVWDVRTGKVWKAFEGHSDCIRSVAFSVGDQLVASGSDDNSVRLWDVNGGNNLLSILRDPEVTEKSVDVMAFSTELMFGDYIYCTLPEGSQVPRNASCVCDCVPGNVFKTPTLVGKPRGGPVRVGPVPHPSTGWARTSPLPGQVPQQTFPTRGRSPRQRGGRGRSPRSGGTTTICLCNKICTCDRIPVFR
jgi:tricorn protease-like protein